MQTFSFPWTGLQEIFQEWRGIGENKKSVAYRITLQDDNKTLTDEIIDSEIKKIKSGLEKNIEGLILR